MAGRIRTVKPELFDDPDLGALPFAARWLFVGLFTQADKRGRLLDDPRRLKVRLCPYDTELALGPLIEALAEARLIVRYAVDGRSYLHIRNFERYQRPHPKEPESEWPAPPVPARRDTTQPPAARREKTRLAVEEQVSQGGSGKEILDLEISDPEISPSALAPGERGPVETPAPRAPDGASAPAAPPRTSPEDVVAAWNAQTQPPIPRCREVPPSRRRKILARLRERSLDAWVAVFQRVQASPFCRGENDRGWTASLDWVIRGPDVAVKLLEGVYDGPIRPASRPGPAARTPDDRAARDARQAARDAAQTERETALAARLDALAPDERTALEEAARDDLRTSAPYVTPTPADVRRAMLLLLARRARGQPVPGPVTRDTAPAEEG